MPVNKCEIIDLPKFLVALGNLSFDEYFKLEIKRWIIYREYQKFLSFRRNFIGNDNA